MRIGRGVIFSKALGLLTAAFLLSVTPAQALTFDISNTVGHNLVFTPGGSFVFTDEVSGNNDDFKVSLQDGGTGVLVNLKETLTAPLRLRIPMELLRLRLIPHSEPFSPLVMDLALRFLRQSTSCS